MDRGFEFAVFERGEFVEKGEDKRGGEVGEEEGNGGEAEPCPEPGLVDGLEDPEDEGDDGSADEGGEKEGLELIGEVGGGGCFVEAKAFFEDKGVVEVEGEGGEDGGEVDESNEGEAGEDGAERP